MIGAGLQIQSQNGGNIGIGYAVPSDTVRSVVNTLKSGGEVEHAYRRPFQETDNGVSLSAESRRRARSEGRPRQGDVVVEADAKKVESASDIQRAVDAHKPGDKLVLKIERGGDRAHRHRDADRRLSSSAALRWAA